MFSLRGLAFGLPSWLSAADRAPRVDIPSVIIHDIEENPEKRARTLKHLIKANHINHSVIYHDLQFHNHAPHILGSAYLLGASADQLNHIYDEESKELEPWVDAPGEISRHDWRDYLGKREYQRAWIDFFEDQLVQHGYDWQELVEDFLFQGKEPLINNMINGLAHGLIHLGYAFELSSRTVAIEALALTTGFYNDMHKYLDDPSYTKPSPFTSESPLEILEKLRRDTRLDDAFTQPGEENLSVLVADKEKEAVMLEYWNSWVITNPKEQFAAIQRAAAALVVGTHKEGEKYDFFLVHLLTSSHALRIVLPLVPAKYHISLLRQWWLFAVSAYIMQLRPAVDVSKIENVKVDGEDWKTVDDRAVNGEYCTDAHYVKAGRAMKEAANTWGDSDQYYLKAALKFSREFNGWGGFGAVAYP